MASAAHIVKIIFSWGLFAGFVVCLVIAPTMALPLAVGSGAASLLPEA